MHEQNTNPDSFDDRRLHQLEQLLVAAGQYVIPSDDHRPKTLEAARAACDERRHIRHAGLAVLSFVASWILCAPLTPWVGTLQRRIMWPSSSEIHRSVYDGSSETTTDSTWRLVEAFDRWGGLSRARSE